MGSAWKTQHELAEDACLECQGSSYVPGRIHEEGIVRSCSGCKGTGKDAGKRAA